VLLNESLNVGQSKAQRPAFRQAHAWQLPAAHLAAHRDLGDGQEFCYFRNSY
jgi:hypothetical protein